MHEVLPKKGKVCKPKTDLPGRRGPYLKKHCPPNGRTRAERENGNGPSTPKDGGGRVTEGGDKKKIGESTSESQEKPVTAGMVGGTGAV